MDIPTNFSMENQIMSIPILLTEYWKKFGW